MSFEPLISPAIARSGVGVRMSSTVDLDDDSARGAGEVGDPRADLVLTAKAKAGHAVSKHRPQSLFFCRLVATKGSGMLDVSPVAAHSGTELHRVCPVSPSPRPSPRWRREREAR